MNPKPSEDRRLLDLIRFIEIYQAMPQTGSIRSVAGALNLSPTAITDCVRRLEDKWSCKLLATAEGSGKATQFTEEAKRAYEHFLRLLQTGGAKDRCPTIHLAHSILTSETFSVPINASFKYASNGEGQSVSRRNVRFLTELTPIEIRRELLSGKIDLSVGWDLRDTEKVEESGLSKETVKTRFPWALISNPQFDQTSIVAGTRIRQDPILRQMPRVACLSEQRQIVPSARECRWLSQCERVEVDTFDAIVALVRSGLADIGFVPHLYHDLKIDVDFSRLNVTSLSAKACIVFLTRNEGSESLPGYVKQFASEMKDWVSETAESPNDIELDWQREFPDDPQWYLDLKFGWYLNRDNNSTSWNSESLFLRFSAKKQSGLLFDGHIENWRTNKFSIYGATASREFFAYSARSENENANLRSFAAIFPYAAKVKGTVNDHMILGVWAGNSQKNAPSFNATIYTSFELNKFDLQGIAAKLPSSILLDSQVFFTNSMPKRDMKS